MHVSMADATLWGVAAADMAALAECVADNLTRRSEADAEAQAHTAATGTPESSDNGG